MNVQLNCIKSNSKCMKRCFITGELCTHQHNIARIREDNYKDGIASAFVVMPFTDITDAMYETIIKPAVEECAGLFAFEKKRDRKGHETVCFISESDRNNNYKSGDARREKVNEIRVNRADQDAMFGYMICNHICQRIQVADIVVVDVSRNNPNVFYEFGLSMALGKMIIPICFNTTAQDKKAGQRTSDGL